MLILRVKGAQLGNGRVLISCACAQFVFLVIVYHWRITLFDFMDGTQKPTQMLIVSMLMDIGALGIILTNVARVVYAVKYGGLGPRACCPFGSAAAKFNTAAFEHAWFRGPTSMILNTSLRQQIINAKRSESNGAEASAAMAVR